MNDKPYIEYMRLDDYIVRFHPRNPKDHSIGDIITSILRFGFWEEPSIDENSGKVAAGHGRGIALNQIMTKMQFSKDDLAHNRGLYEHESGAILPRYIDIAKDGMWLLPVSRGKEHYDEAHVNAYLIASNRLVTLGGWDDNALAEMLQELALEDGDILESTGYDGDDLDTLLRDLEGYDDSNKDVSDGSLLSLLDITIDEPSHLVERGDIWMLGQHILICCDVISEWHIWQPYLKGDTALFCPYPGVFVPLSKKADEFILVMVQPDTYISGHILDRFTEIHGEDSVSKLN